MSDPKQKLDPLPERMSAAEFLHLKQKGADRKNKFGNKRILTPDGAFDSQAEFGRWVELKMMAAGRQIENLKRQSCFQLPSCKYYADFTYWDLVAKAWVVEDVKGVRTQTYQMKKRLMREELGIMIKEIRPKCLKRGNRHRRAKRL